MRNIAFFTVVILCASAFSSDSYYCNNLDGVQLGPDGSLYVVGSSKGPVRLEPKTSSEDLKTYGNTVSPSTDKTRVTTNYSYSVAISDGRPTRLTTVATRQFPGSMNLPMTTAYDVAVDSHGSCIVQDVKQVESKTIMYDAKLCKNLSDLLAGMDKSDVAKCNDILRQMSTAVKDYKATEKGWKLAYNLPNKTNPFSAALNFAGDCKQKMSASPTAFSADLDIPDRPVTGENTHVK